MTAWLAPWAAIVVVGAVLARPTTASQPPLDAAEAVVCLRHLGQSDKPIAPLVVSVAPVDDDLLRRLLDDDAAEAASFHVDVPTMTAVLHALDATGAWTRPVAPPPHPFRYFALVAEDRGRRREAGLPPEAITGVVDALVAAVGADEAGASARGLRQALDVLRQRVAPSVR